MDEKKIYAVYVDLLRLHKEFYGITAFYSERESFVQRINYINSKHNSYFCYMMCEVLRKWFLKGFGGIDKDDVSKYYADIWHFHHGYIGKVEDDIDYEKLSKEANTIASIYSTDECEEMLLAIVADLDANNKQQAGA